MTNQPNLTDIRHFLEEDIGSGDVTALLIDENKTATATVITREPMVLCGQHWFDAVFKQLNPNINIQWRYKDGDFVEENAVLCRLQGNARNLLTGERTALNLLQTLSATATQSKAYFNAVAGTHSKVLDTRKTIPGLRKAQKYAVLCGGCLNHRIGLYDAVLIKENHIIAAGSIAKAIKKAREQTSVLIEIEVESMDELTQAIQAKPDRIMLDNFSVASLKKAVFINNPPIKLEASGDINLNNIAEIAQTGVDYISIGALTKHVNAINLSMRIEFTV
ncbi:MAG: carboxylating nicotinate-nucleotide diphosphorylase [Methylococcales bacterium]|nr:carboxylating nicotinate-nucleotide diphosphorylase [Methylococcales bacterium]MCK5925401.1 carboxylating nicotinate-nucleotide diphosphorylase [Methylococcales bacterium]